MVPRYVVALVACVGARSDPEQAGGDLPVVSARYVTNAGPRGPHDPGPNWGLRVGPDRTVVERGRTTGRLTPEQWQSLLDAFAAVEFTSLPAHVGVSRRPCEPVYEIEYRSRAGVHVVRLLAEPDSPELEPRWSGVSAAWDALPGRHKPELFFVAARRAPKSVAGGVDR